MRMFYSFLFMCCIVFSGCAQSRSQFLDEYFGKETYDIQGTGLYTSSRIELSLAKSSKPDRSVDKAIVYSVINDRVQVYLKIIGPLVINGLGTTISDVSGVSGGFWGWNMTLLKRVTDKSIVGISLDCLSGNSGQKITDHPNIIWDVRNNRFFIDSIDRSQF